MRLACSEIAFRRAISVLGYHRERIPLPFSPRLFRDEPGARMPARWVRFNTSVRNPRSTESSGALRSKSRTNSRVGVNSAIRAARFGPWSSAARQNAATSRSSSISTARSDKFSMIAVSETIAPPANGSISILGRVRDNHARMCGTSHVLPPGYRSGLRCGTCATLTAGMRLTGYGISGSELRAISRGSPFDVDRFWRGDDWLGLGPPKSRP